MTGSLEGERWGKSLVLGPGAEKRLSATKVDLKRFVRFSNIQPGGETARRSGHQSQAGDLRREEGVEDEDDGFGTRMQVQLNLALLASEVEDQHADPVV